MLSAVVLQLTPVKEALLPVSHGSLAYAGALDLLLRLNPALTVQIHDSPGMQPLTVSPLSGSLGRDNHSLLLSPSSLCRWRLTGLNRPVTEMLLSLSPLLGGVRMGEAIFNIVDVAVQSEQDDDSGQDDYTGLLERWEGKPPPSRITLQFLTPTTFRNGNLEHVFPLPRLVWGSLLERWNAWSPVPCKESKASLEEGVVLTNWKGETRRLALGRHQTVGFIGKFTYSVIGDFPTLRKLLPMLADFAFYAGVGWQTTQGMGQTCWHKD